MPKRDTPIRPEIWLNPGIPGLEDRQRSRTPGVSRPACPFSSVTGA